MVWEQGQNDTLVLAHAKNMRKIHLTRENRSVCESEPMAFELVEGGSRRRLVIKRVAARVLSDRGDFKR